MTLISWEVMDNFHFQIPWYFRWLRGQDEGGCGGRRSWKISFQNFVPVVNFWSADILTVFQSSLDLCWFFFSFKSWLFWNWGSFCVNSHCHLPSHWKCISPRNGSNLCKTILSVKFLNLILSEARPDFSIPVPARPGWFFSC